jgi:hypothetical protein
VKFFPNRDKKTQIFPLSGQKNSVQNKCKLTFKLQTNKIFSDQLNIDHEILIRPADQIKLKIETPDQIIIEPFGVKMCMISSAAEAAEQARTPFF